MLWNGLVWSGMGNSTLQKIALNACSCMQISRRSMELDTQSERDEMSRRGTQAMPSPATSMGSRRSKGSRLNSRIGLQLGIDPVTDRMMSCGSAASSGSTMSLPSQAHSPGQCSPFPLIYT